MAHKEEPQARPSGSARFRSRGPCPGVLVLFGTLGLSAGGGYSPVRPGFYPLIVAGGLLFFGVTLLVRTTAKPEAYLREKAVSESEATYWSTISLLLAVLAAYAFLLDPLGYVFATALFFPLMCSVTRRRAAWSAIWLSASR